MASVDHTIDPRSSFAAEAVSRGGSWRTWRVDATVLVSRVHLKTPHSREEVENHIREQNKLFRNGPIKVVFADELVESLSSEWNKTKEEVVEILRRSL